MRRAVHHLTITLAAGLLVAGSAGAQESRTPPAKIDVMPRAAGGIDPVAEFAKGVVALEAKQYDVAAKALDRATKGAPEHYNSWGFLAAAKAGLGDWTGSKAAYEQMLHIEPMSAHGHAGLALAFAALKDDAGAKTQLQWLDERLKMCTGKCTDRVLLQTMIPQIRSVMAGTTPPAPMARLDDRRLEGLSA